MERESTMSEDDNNNKRKSDEMTGELPMDSDDEGLTASVPSGIKRYEYYEFTKRTVPAPKENDNYTEDELEHLLKKTLVVYRLMLPIRDLNYREKYFCACVHKRYYEDAEVEPGCDGNNRGLDESIDEIEYLKEDTPSNVDHEAIETAIDNVWLKTKNDSATDEERRQVLFDIFDKIKESTVESATQNDMKKNLQI